MRYLFLTTFIFMHTLFATTIHVGYDASAMSSFSKKDLKIATDIYLQEIVKGYDYKIDFKYYTDMSLMAKDINEEKLDFVTGYGLNFIKYIDLSKLEDGFSAGFHDGKKEKFVVLVQKKSNLNSWKDLEGKEIGIYENDDIANLYIENKKHVNSVDQINIKKYTNRQRTLLKLFFGKVDAALVTNRTFNLLKELNPQIGRALQIIDRTELQATSFGFLRRSLNPKLKAFLRMAPKRLTSSIRSRQILVLYKTETLTDSKLQDLKPIEELYKQILKFEKEKNK